MKKVGGIFIVIGWLGLQVIPSPTGGQELFDVQAANEHFNRALTLYFQKDYTGAIEEFVEAVKINPDNAKAYYFIGYSYYKRGEFTQAAEAFEKAYALDPKYSPIPQPSPATEPFGQ
jgi:tetratricopeptide (TPR) repeat protein